jgi:hypothetical protein
MAISIKIGGFCLGFLELIQKIKKTEQLST